ncbi:hypothetical protein [Salimicrobium halophilum]|uniref:hypothetical protein n=1 Tax=Salimicrobium halophilum TaxID=86666 RepID=UPI00115FE5B8|nr:hypothetical protein [Salimicrobium halophilum]
MQFLEWFGSSVPCDTFVVVSNRKARIDGDVPTNVLRPNSLPFHVRKKEGDVCIDKIALRKRLLESHQPREVDVMKRMKLQPRDIIPGVRCLECGSLKMKRRRTVWHCSCGAFDKKAHLATLRDYKLLFGEQITNRQARWFLQMDDYRAVHHILKTNSLKSEGPNKKKIYFLR